MWYGWERIISADPGFGHPERCCRVRGHYGYDAVRDLPILSVGAVSARSDAGLVPDGHELRLRKQCHERLCFDHRKLAPRRRSEMVSTSSQPPRE